MIFRSVDIAALTENRVTNVQQNFLSDDGISSPILAWWQAGLAGKLALHESK